PKKAELMSMIRDGRCCYWLMAAVEALSTGLKPSQLSYGEPALTNVKAKIIENGIAYRETLVSKKLDVDDIWFSNVGETVNDFFNKVTALSNLRDNRSHVIWLEK
ncbi:MAG: hypothetical protein ACK53L_15505, partial [Pirellulaceae bacterium]